MTQRITGLGPRSRRDWRPGRLLILVLHVLLAAACGPGNHLGGSVGDILPLEFSQVRITPSGQDLVIAYTQGVDLICRITLTAAGQTLHSGDTLTNVAFSDHVSLSRATLAHDSFASLRAGSLSLDSYSLVPGQEASGHFLMLLSDGHTLNGSYQQAVVAP